MTTIKNFMINRDVTFYPQRLYAFQKVSLTPSLYKYKNIDTTKFMHPHSLGQLQSTDELDFSKPFM